MPDKIKVFYLIERMARAGTELSLLKLLQHIDRSRFEPVLCCLNDTLTDRSLVPADIRYLTLGAKWNLASPAILFLYRSLCKLLREEKPDVVHSFLFVSNLLGPFAAKNARVPAAVASRGRMGIEWQANVLHRVGARAADRRTAAIICKTEAIGQEIERVERVPPAKIRIIPNGVDTKHYCATKGREESRRVLHAQTGVSTQDPLILAVGNLKPIKGHSTLVDATARLRAQGLRFQVAILGKGEHEETLRAEVAEQGLGDIIHLPGNMADVRPWMNAADLFVATSHSEGMPNAVLEAMSMRLPTILSEIPGHVETAGETAWYFQRGDAAGLADQIRGALGMTREELDVRGYNGAARVHAEFSLYLMVKRIEDVYREVLGRGRP